MLKFTVRTSYSGEFSDQWLFSDPDEAARVMVSRANLGMIRQVVSIEGEGWELSRYASTVSDLDEDWQRSIAVDALWITL